MFPRFSYSRNRLQSFGPPVELLARGMEEKEKKYEYVVDTTEKLGQALSSMPHTSADAPKLAAAQNKLNEVVQGYTDDGDLENKYLDAKRLAGDLDREFGLTAMQQQYAQEQEYIKDAKERYAKGDISATALDKGLAETTYLNRKGIEKGEAGWRSNFRSRRILNKFDAAKEAEDFIKGIKASTIIDPDTGVVYRYDDKVQGYITVDSGEEVSADRIARAARGYLSQNPDFQDKVRDDIYYELNAMLRDPETEQRRKMTADDFQRVTGVAVNKALGEQFGNKTIQELEAEGVDLENLYTQLRAEQELNRAIAPVVGKHAYANLSRTHLTDWAFRSGLSGGSKDKTDPIIAHSYLEAFHTEDRYNSKDLELRTQIRAQAIDQLKEKRQLLSQVDPQDPGTTKRLEQEIADLNETIRKTDEHIDNVIEFSPAIQRDIEKAVANDGEGAYDISKGNVQGSIEGLDINRGELMNLVNTSLSRELSAAELSEYISPSVSAEEDLSGNSPRMEAISALRGKINRIASNIEEKIDDDDIVYNRTYNYLNLGDLSAKEKEASSYHQFDKQLNMIPKANANWHTQFNPVGMDVSLAEAIVDEYDIDEDDDIIQWRDATIKPLLDNRRDREGNYKPLYGLSVPIKIKGGGTKTATVTAYGSNKDRDTRYVDALKDMYRRYTNIKNPNGSQTKVKEALATNLFNLTKAGREFDLFDLRGAKNRQVFDIPLDEETGIKADIMAFTKGSPDGRKYYLISDEKTDRQGNPLFYAANSAGDLFTYTASQIKSSSDLTAVGADTPTGLKRQLATMWAQTRPEYRVNTTELIDARKVFGNDIKEGVDARLTPNAIDSLQAVKALYPDLYMTDGLRDENVSYGADDSKHKDANAVDLRLTKGARKLAALPTPALTKLGIKSAEYHNDHIHVVFL